MAIGSNPDTTSVRFLLPLLEDPEIAVRIAAAYSLGQIGETSAEKPLTDAYLPADTIPGFAELNCTILEAIGKCGSVGSLKHIAEISTLVPSDTLMVLAQIRAVFRFMTRGITHPKGDELAVKLLRDDLYGYQIKLMASSYLARVPGKSLGLYAADLLSIWNKNDDVFIRANLARAFGKHDVLMHRDLLLTTAADESKDMRIRVNAIQTLSDFPSDEIEQSLDNLLFDNNLHVQYATGSYFIKNGNSLRSRYYFNRSRTLSASDFGSRVGLMAAALKWTPYYQKSFKDSISNIIKSELKQTTNPANKKLLFEALSYDLNNLVFLKNEVFSDSDIAHRSAAVLAFGKLAENPEFDLFFQSFAPETRAFIAKYLAIAAMDHKSGLTSPASEAIVAAGAGIRLYMSDTLNFEGVLDSLVLPRQSEDYISLVNLIRILKPGKTIKAFKPVYNHPIDWDVVSSIPDSTTVRITTSRGEVDILLLKRTAPATVAQFIQLIQNKFYEDKIFHRVVPGFVIQGGCTRGDGYGSLDFSIRTETPPVYFDDEGYVGMASAGRHTESQQFFITMAPTPHLDGKYTIFGRVRRGMDVVLKTAPGDIIKKIELL
jgi:cyclophilin family peptidyl-prolyl cis-trans isomerase